MAEHSLIEDVSNDYERQAVPLKARKSFWSVTMVWTGYVFVVTSMMAGGGLAAGFSFGKILLITVLGNLFLSVVAILMSYIAAKTGLTFALISRYSFGLEGSRVSSLFGPVVNMGWYTVQSALYGHFIARLIGLDAFGEGVAMVLSALVMGIFAMIGIGALTVLGLVSIPAIIFLSVATMLKAVSTLDHGWSDILAMVPQNPGVMMAGVTAVIGTWIFSASTCIADIMRYARNMKEACLSTFVGLVVGNSIMLICGAVAAMAVQESDLTAVLFKLSLLFPSFVLMTTNIFTTNGANIYSNALGLSNVFRRFSSRKIMVVLLVISAALTLTHPYKIDNLFLFLKTLAKIVPPLPGIIMADFFLLHRMSYPDLATLDHGPKIKWNALIAWVAAVVLVFLIPDTSYLLPSLNGIVLGGGIYYILMKLNPCKEGGAA